MAESSTEEEKLFISTFNQLRRCETGVERARVCRSLVTQLPENIVSHDWEADSGTMIIWECKKCDSASSSKFYHLALLVALVSHSSNFHHWSLLALLAVLVLR